ncbi:FAST kinase domain-containing protein 3, mitochondrial-like [Prorops nasuta]|uniref:FAST kinase domain-containing protein 3, mitochondrial-like n=1 Tax=Prorops nasuta TaxID=863751 RepID=UPI0034CDA315
MIVGGSRASVLNRIFSRSKIVLQKSCERWIQSAGEENSSVILTKTTIFLQEGVNIVELPFLVRKMGDIKGMFEKENKADGVISEQQPQQPQPQQQQQQQHADLNTKNESSDALKKTTRESGDTGTNLGSLAGRIDIETEEGTAILFTSDLDYLKNSDVQQILDSLNSCFTTKGLYSLLETKVAEEINCRVAVQGLRRMMELENNQNRHRFTKILRNEQILSDPSTRDTVLKQLVKLIVRSRDSELILQGLVILRKDRLSPSKNLYRDWLCEEALIRATDGEFSLPQLIDVVKILSSYKDENYRNCVDIMWAGIAAREKDINEETIVPLFKLLQHFNESRNVVKIILERSLEKNWRKLNGSEMADILACFNDTAAWKKSLNIAGEWAVLNMNMSSEKHLLNFMQSLHALGYIDESIGRALEEFARLKGRHVKDANLLVSIMDYCENLRFRNKEIFVACGEYFIKNATQIRVSLLSSFVTPFGMLNIQPPRSQVFWQVFDKVLTKKFASLRPNDALDILLSCTYLAHFPEAFVERLFTSQFLQKVYVSRNSTFIRRLRNKLKLLDFAMSLECEQYKGPFLSTEKMTRPLLLDMRIRRAIGLVYQPLVDLIGDPRKISRSVILTRLPPLKFYILDIILHPHSVTLPVFHLNLQEKKEVYTSILIHLPEHYCRDSDHLIGPQVMRKRHLRRLGFRVATLDYVTLRELSESDKLSPYLSKRLAVAEDPL